MKQRDQTSTLLQYTVTTDPSPVNISSANNPATAKIFIAAAANSAVDCKYIAIQVPIGDEATDMYQVSPIPTASSNNPDWAPSSDVVPGMGTSTSNSKNFLFKHVAENMAVNTPFTITIDGTVNSTSGVAEIEINERSTLTTDGTYMTRQKPEDITKAAEETFFLNNVIATYTDTPGIPVTLLQGGRDVQLQWQSNGDYFKVYAGGNSGPISEGSNKYYDIGTGLLSDTVFIVEATKDDKTLYQEFFIKLERSKASFTQIDVNQASTLSQGTVDILSNSVVFYDGLNFPNNTYSAATDGFVVITMSMNTTLSDDCASVALAVWPNSGGQAQYYHSSATGQYSANTLTVPIKKGDRIVITCYYSHQGSNSCWMTCLWTGIGQGNINQSGYLKQEESLLSEQHQKATAFITALETAFEKNLKEETRNRLIEKFLR